MTGSALSLFRRRRALLDALSVRIHPERWQGAGIGMAAAARLTGQARSRRILSLRLDWLTDGGASGGDVWPDWSEWQDGEVAVVLAESGLERRACCLGASLFRDEVATLVLGRDVAALKGAIGADSYFFALRQGGLIREVAALSRQRAGAGELAERVLQAGRLGLAAWLGGIPGSLAERVTDTLPVAVDAAVAEVRAWSESEQADWRRAAARVFSFYP